jgi:hypothetical protein
MVLMAKSMDAMEQMGVLPADFDRTNTDESYPLWLGQNRATRQTIFPASSCAQYPDELHVAVALLVTGESQVPLLDFPTASTLLGLITRSYDSSRV